MESVADCFRHSKCIPESFFFNDGASSSNEASSNQESTPTNSDGSSLGESTPSGDQMSCARIEAQETTEEIISAFSAL